MQLVPFFNHWLSHIRQPAHRVNHLQRSPKDEVRHVPVSVSSLNLLLILNSIANHFEIFVRHFCFQNSISFSILLIAFQITNVPFSAPSTFVLLIYICVWVIGGDEVAAEGEVKVDAVLQPLVSEGNHCVAGVDGSALGFEDLDDGYEAF